MIYQDITHHDVLRQISSLRTQNQHQKRPFLSHTIFLAKSLANFSSEILNSISVSIRSIWSSISGRDETNFHNFWMQFRKCFLDKKITQYISKLRRSCMDATFVPNKRHASLLKMGQTRPLFVYFCSFHMTNIAQIL